MAPVGVEGLGQRVNQGGLLPTSQFDGSRGVLQGRPGAAKVGILCCRIEPGQVVVGNVVIFVQCEGTAVLLDGFFVELDLKADVGEKAADFSLFGRLARQESVLAFRCVAVAPLSVNCGQSYAGKNRIGVRLERPVEQFLGFVEVAETQMGDGLLNADPFIVRLLLGQRLQLLERLVKLSPPQEGVGPLDDLIEGWE